MGSELQKFRQSLDTTRDYPSEEELAAWPNCPIPDCEWKACLSLDSYRCWRHTVEFDGDPKTLSDEDRRILEKMYWAKRRTGDRA
jgi:hypothetical protein